MLRMKLFSAATLLALATACGGPIVAMESETHTFPETGASPRVVVASFNGDLTVRTGNENQVFARVEKKGRGWSDDDAEDSLRDIRVSYETDGNTLRVTVRHNGSTTWDDEGGADIELTVPAAAVLDLTTDNGVIATNGTSAGITARTTNGSIDVTGGQGVLDLRTTNGSINASPSGAAIADFQTTNGRIDFNGPLMQGIHNFESTNGDIELRLPSGSAFEFDLSTTNGDADVGFSYSTTGGSSNTSLRGMVGDGGGTQIRARSTNGDVRIDKR